MHNMSDVQLPNVKKYEVDYLLLGVTFESEAPTVHLVVSSFMVLLGCANVAKYSAVKSIYCLPDFLDFFFVFHIFVTFTYFR